APRCFSHWNGLAVANHIAIPVAMMKAPSVTPTPRKNWLCSRGISSGWRADASRNFAVAMPIPMQDPRAGIAISRATASGRKSDVGMAWLLRLCLGSGASVGARARWINYPTGNGGGSADVDRFDVVAVRFRP